MNFRIQLFAKRVSHSTFGTGKKYYGCRRLMINLFIDLEEARFPNIIQFKKDFQKTKIITLNKKLPLD